MDSESNKFTYYSVSGKYKITNDKDNVQNIEHFSNDDETEDKLKMVYQNTNIKILNNEEAKKLIEKYL